MPSLIAASVAPALRELAARKPTAVTLINNAAVASPAGLLGALDAAALESALATNVTAPLVLTDLFCRAFPDAAIARRVINVSSGAAQSPIAGSSAYCASKAAIEMLTRTLAIEQPQIESIAIRPGISKPACRPTCVRSTRRSSRVSISSAASRRTGCSSRPLRSPRGSSTGLRSARSSRDASMPTPTSRERGTHDTPSQTQEETRAMNAPEPPPIPAWQTVPGYPDIVYDKCDEGIAKITINRPEVRNAFRPETRRR